MRMVDEGRARTCPAFPTMSENHTVQGLFVLMLVRSVCQAFRSPSQEGPTTWKTGATCQQLFRLVSAFGEVQIGPTGESLAQ